MHELDPRQYVHLQLKQYEFFVYIMYLYLYRSQLSVKGYILAWDMADRSAHVSNTGLHTAEDESSLQRGWILLSELRGDRKG